MRKMHKYLKLEPVMAYQVDKEETVHTLYVTAVASEGDYIIEGAFHELYPCKKEVFERTYCKVGKLSMYERIRKYYCKKLMEANDIEAANMILSLLHAEDEGCLAKPVSSEDKENLLDWDGDLEGRY